MSRDHSLQRLCAGRHLQIGSVLPYWRFGEVAQVECMRDERMRLVEEVESAEFNLRKAYATYLQRK